MDSIKEKQTTDPFPLETLNRLKTAAAPGAGKTSDYTARNYDNRARLSDMAGQLQSKLDAFQTRINTSAFLSEAFTWRVNSARTDDSDRLLAKAESILQPIDYSLKISRLATSWATESDKLSSNDASPVETGTYSYTLTIDDTAYEIDVEIENNIGDPATNRDVLLAVERSINRLGLDVTASLEDFQEKNVSDRLEGSFRKMSYLKVSRSSTGENLSASLADTDGELIETLGLKGARQFGHNSEYRINGALFEDDSNTVSFVSGKVAAHLSGITGNDENLKIMIDRDARYLAQELESVIGSYNELIDWIDDNGSVINSRLKDALFTDMDSMATRPRRIRTPESETGADAEETETLATDLGAVLNLDAENTVDASLSEIGLTLTPEGRIEVSEDFADAVAGQLKMVHETLAGENGFFTKISEALSRLQDQRTSQYVMAYNSVLSYSSESTGRKSIYQESSGSIISFFA